MTGFCINRHNFRLVLNHPFCHGNHRNLMFNLINVVSYKYILSVTNLSFIPAASLK